MNLHQIQKPDYRIEYLQSRYPEMIFRRDGQIIKYHHRNNLNDDMIINQEDLRGWVTTMADEWARNRRLHT